MKQKQFTNEQIVAILGQAEKGEKPIVEVCREHGITENMFYRWRNKFGSVSVKEVQRLRELEKENARLKKRHKRWTFLVCLLLLLALPCVVCVVWVRKEQRQYALNRQLIAALKQSYTKQSDTKQALALIEAGADPNARSEPPPTPSLSSLIKQLLHASRQANTSNTAFLLACGTDSKLQDSDGTSMLHLSSPDPQLTQAMLVHGANIHVKDRCGLTSLHCMVINTTWNPSEYKTDKEIIQQLLDYGADPDEEDKTYKGDWGETPMHTALCTASSVLVRHPDIVPLLRKYSKHP